MSIRRVSKDEFETFLSEFPDPVEQKHGYWGTTPVTLVQRADAPGETWPGQLIAKVMWRSKVAGPAASPDEFFVRVLPTPLRIRDGNPSFEQRGRYFYGIVSGLDDGRVDIELYSDEGLSGEYEGDTEEDAIALIVADGFVRLQPGTTFVPTR